MKINLFVYGKIRTPGLRDAADYYLKLLQPWVSIEEIEFKAISIPDKSPATRKLIQQKEAELLLNRLAGSTTPIYLLDEEGKPLSTQDWAKQAGNWETQGLSQIALCIGSSLGFDDSLRKMARGKLSLGPQTLSFELTRVVLLEQLYRSWSIIRRHPYHNAGS